MIPEEGDASTYTARDSMLTMYYNAVICSSGSEDP